MGKKRRRAKRAKSKIGVPPGNIIKDKEHVRCFYEGEGVIKVESDLKFIYPARPSLVKRVLNPLSSISYALYKVDGTLYLTDQRLLFIRDLKKDEEIPSTAPERIALRKERQYSLKLNRIIKTEIRRGLTLSKQLSVSIRYPKGKGSVRWTVKDPTEWIKAIDKLRRRN